MLLAKDVTAVYSRIIHLSALREIWQNRPRELSVAFVRPDLEGGRVPEEYIEICTFVYFEDSLLPGEALQENSAPSLIE